MQYPTDINENILSITLKHDAVDHFTGVYRMDNFFP
jgi:hypothetical protein